MREKILSVFMSLAIAFTACASDYNAVEVTDNTGQTTVLLLEDNPTAKYVDGELVINSASATLVFPQEETVEVVFKEQGYDGVEKLEGTSAIALKVEPENVRLLNLPPASSVFLFSLSGSLVASDQSDAEGSAVLPLSQPGVYVIKTDAKTFKIVKK